MKIFAYDTKTQKRGECLGERSVCSGHGSGSIVCKGDQEWITLDKSSAVDNQNKPITAEQYGQDAICFCIGQMFAGTDSSWNWVIVKRTT